MTATLCLSSFDMSSHSASGFLWRHIAPRMEPAQLYGPLARRPFFGLFAPKSDFILGTGHGTEDEWTAQGESPVWKVGHYDPAEVKDKTIKLVSCLAGQELGPDLVANGALCFMGYDDDLVWLVDSGYFLHPWDDPVAKLCMLPIVDGVHALLDGGTCAESMEVEMANYRRNLELTDSDMIRSCLQFNHDHAVLLGNPEATVRRRPHISLPPPPPMLI